MLVLVFHVIFLVFPRIKAAESIQYLPELKTGHVTKDISLTIATSAVKKISTTRSLIECALNCRRSSLKCSRAIRDQWGKCYEIMPHKSDSGTQTEFLVTGDLVEYFTSDQHDNCGGKECSEQEVCFKGSMEEELTSPVCVAEHDRSECDIFQEYQNLRHYWATLSDSTSSGKVMSLTYPKKSNDSGLRVTLNMVVGAHLGYAGCYRWYLTFDGHNCSNPASIEFLDYTADTGKLYRSIDIDGTCYGLEAGNIEVDIVVDHCSGYSTSTTLTGWKYARTMLLMEVTSPRLETGLTKPCPLLNVFNYQYYTWTDIVAGDQELSLINVTVKTVEFEKMADDTSLRIKFSALTSISLQSSGSIHCARWYITIDDVECNPQLDYIISHLSTNRYNYWKSHGRVRTAEGICDNVLEAGFHFLSVKVGQCTDVAGWQPTPILTGGLSSVSNLHIEEVRLKQAVDGVSVGSQMYRTHSGYLTRYHWWKANFDINSGDIMTFTHHKSHSDTALRLTASGNHVTRESTVSPGASVRWYFKINRQDCPSPGKIEGTNHFDHTTAYHHPMQVSGICHGLLSGAKEISYAVENQFGYSTVQTGYYSSFHIFIEELRVESVETCSGYPSTC